MSWSMVWNDLWPSGALSVYSWSSLQLELKDIMWLTWCLYGVGLHLLLHGDLLQWWSCEGLQLVLEYLELWGSTSVCLSSSTGWPAWLSLVDRPVGPSSGLSALFGGVYWTTVVVRSSVQGSEVSSVVTIEKFVIKGRAGSMWVGMTASRARPAWLWIGCLHVWMTYWMRLMLWMSGELCPGLGPVGTAHTLLQVVCGEPGGLVCQGGLVLHADPIPCLMISYCMLQDHNLHHFSYLFIGNFALADDGTDSIWGGMYTFIWELL